MIISYHMSIRIIDHIVLCMIMNEDIETVEILGFSHHHSNSKKNQSNSHFICEEKERERQRMKRQYVYMIGV